MELILICVTKEHGTTNKKYNQDNRTKSHLNDLRLVTTAALRVQVFPSAHYDHRRQSQSPDKAESKAAAHTLLHILGSDHFDSILNI